MDIIVDASVLIAVISNEPGKDALIGVTKNADLIAPFSVHWEIGNAFSAMLRRNRVTIHKALEAIEVYYQIPLRYVDVELEESLKIAGELGIFSYDAYLIRCALKYASPLISLDRNLIAIAKKLKISVIEVAR